MRSNGQSASSQALTARQSGSSSDARSPRTQERTDAAPAIGSARAVVVTPPQGVDVDATDHVTALRIEHGVGESGPVLEVALVHLEVGEVLGEAHLVRPEPHGKPGVAWMCAIDDDHAA